MNIKGLFIVLLLAAAPTAPALEFVTAEMSENLKDDFERAQNLDVKTLKQIKGRELKCDMYGVRTRLQVERDVLLYRFSMSNSKWENEGAQVVRNYQVGSSGLVGKRGGLTDRVRVLNDRMISELTVETHDAKTAVLAYSVCNIKI